jgi:hypothetical protein
MMARAHAQATGDAVEVTYSPATGRVQARLYAPWSKEMELGEVQPGTSPLASGTVAADGDRAGMDSSSTLAGHEPIAEGWASRSLGEGIRIARRRPGASDAQTRDATAADDYESAAAPDDQVQTLEDLADGQEVRLAVFMPDGSALVGDDLWLNDGGGRCGMISINPWSGLPMFQRLADLTDEALSASARDQAVDSAVDALANGAPALPDPFLPPLPTAHDIDDDAAPAGRDD